jgi:hypothetical protein
MTADDKAQLALDLARPLADSEDRRGCRQTRAAAQNFGNSAWIGRAQTNSCWT